MSIPSGTRIRRRIEGDEGVVTKPNSTPGFVYVRMDGGLQKSLAEAQIDIINPEIEDLLDISDVECLDEVKNKLRYVINEGIGKTDLTTLIIKLACEVGETQYSIQRIAEALVKESQQRLAITNEAEKLKLEAKRQNYGDDITANALLPFYVAKAITARTRYLPTDGPSAVVPFLTAVAGLTKIGTMVEGSKVANYRVPTNIFGCTVSQSGGKKTPGAKLLVEYPTKALVVDMAKANEQEQLQWKESCRGLKKTDQPPPPFPKHLQVNDYTGEALAAQLQAQESKGLGLLIYRDELSGLFGGFDKYSNGKGNDEQQMLELFDGGGLSSIRIVGNRHYSRSQVSIYGSIQPELLRELVANGDASGLWARFLFVPLPRKAVSLPLTTTPVEVEEMEAAAAKLAEICDAVYKMPARTYELDEHASKIFVDYELKEQKEAIKASIGAVSALHGKSAGKVLRVAGVLHLIEIADGGLASNGKISSSTINKAIYLVGHLNDWALSLHSGVATGGGSELMRTVHKLAEQAQYGQPIRWKEVQNQLTKAQRKDVDSEAVNEAMRALASAGYGVIEMGQRGGTSYKATAPLP